MDALLECRGLTKSYGRKTALSGVDLTISRGKIVGLLGPNGSGKTTLIKLACGLLTPTAGQILVEGKEPGVESRLAISYLPDKNYLNDWMKVSDLVDYFKDFYSNFDPRRAYDMLSKLNIDPDLRLKTLSKGTKEKVQLILVMSRKAKLYLLDEPIAGVDPAARDYILTTILNNYNPEGTVLISTHLISDIERVLDEVIFIQNGQVIRQELVDDIREKEGKSVDELFREVFRTIPYGGGAW